jgi:hypothetical protein
VFRLNSCGGLPKSISTHGEIFVVSCVDFLVLQEMSRNVSAVTDLFLHDTIVTVVTSRLVFIQSAFFLHGVLVFV